ICVAVDGGRVEYGWNDVLTEWFVNDIRGLEHGYTVQQRPKGTGPLQFRLAARGSLRASVSGDGQSIAFINEAGASVVNYNGLMVFDADGRDLPAWFEAPSVLRVSSAKSQAFRIVVDDRGAHYPLTIDPIAQQAYLKASNTGAFDQFGLSMAVSGDTVV